MAKNKRGARGAKGARLRATASVANNGRHSHALGALNELLTSRPGGSGFTLQDEARHTAKGHSDWDRTINLRGRPVVFVTGGFIEPLEDPVLRDAADAPALSEEDAAGAESGSHPLDADAILEPTAELTLKETVHVVAVSDNELAATTLGASSIAAISHHVSRLADSSSPLETEPSPDEDTDSSEEVILFQGRGQRRRSESNTPIEKKTRVETETLESATTVLKAISVRGRRPGGNGTPQKHRTATQSDEEAIIADYIANMDIDDLAATARHNPLLRQELGGSDGEVMLGDGTDESLSGDEVAHKATEAGSQSDEPPSDGEDSASPETTSRARRRLPFRGGVSGQLDDSLESDQGHDNLSDEQIARLLAKQEELGLGGDELLLYDDTGKGMPDDEEPDEDDDEGQPWDDRLFVDQGKSRGYRPDAGTVADAADDFDLMDWNRPSLRNNVRRKKGMPVFNISDTELEAGLKSAWQKDRFKKQEKRQAREALRAAGMLNKHADPTDLRLKYPNGITMDEVENEIRDFLISSAETLTLPPMDANARKIVHEVANRFKIKSKSTGAGANRRPVLHRTKITVKYTELHFETTMARTQRRKFARPSGKAAGAGAGRVNHAAVTVRDGEVVGGSAPEIGTANKGRKLLEKMGWSSGDALGAVDNKGRTAPIEHIVKRSRTGLG